VTSAALLIVFVSRARRELGAGHRHTERADRKRFGRIARPRPPHRERIAYRALIVQDTRQKNRHPARTTEQVIKNYLRNVYDKIASRPAGTGAVHHPPPDFERSAAATEPLPSRSRVPGVTVSHVLWVKGRPYKPAFVFDSD